jgi:PAS domain S-box-containing protein
MEEEKGDINKFMSIDKFISELIGYHERIKQLQASEVQYKLLSTTLQESLNKYQAVVDHLPQKIYLKDHDSRYLLANESYAQSLGVSPQQIFGKRDHDFFPPATAEQSLNEDREVMGKGVPAEHEGRYTREGRVNVERIVKAPVKNVSGETAGILGISWDITDQKAREEEWEKRATDLARLLEARNEELKEVQAKFQLEHAQCRTLEEKLKSLEGSYSILFENTGTAVAVIEDNWTLSRVNTEFERISGYSRAELEGGKHWNDFVHNGRPENAGEATISPDPVSLAPGMKVLQFMNKQNQERTVSLISARIPDTSRVMISLADITKYKQAREDLNRLMKHLSEMMGEMERGVKSLDE